MAISSLECKIKPEDKVFFLHIPKTAGTTLAALIEQRFEQYEMAPFLFSWQLPVTPPQFFTSYRYFRGHVDYDVMHKLLEQDPVCLTMVREPVARLISAFANLQRAPIVSEPLDPDREHRLKLIRQITLEEFLSDAHPLLTQRVAHSRNQHTRMLAASLKFSTHKELQDSLSSLEKPDPFLHYLRVETLPQTLLKQAKKRLETIAFFGLTERFQDSLFLLAYTFGWPPLVDIQRLNVAPFRSRQEQLLPETVQKLKEFNTLDIELYTYAQQLFETRYLQMSYELLERYGQRTHARMKLPLTITAMQELLERHYARRYVERHQPVQAVNVTFNEVLAGTGWHYPEEHPEHGTYCWTGPGIHSSLHFMLEPTEDKVIRFSILAAITEDVLNSLRLRVNRQPVALTRQYNNGLYSFEGVISHVVLVESQGFVRLDFKVDETIAPCTFNPDSNDERQLGVAMSGLKICSI